MLDTCTGTCVELRVSTLALIQTILGNMVTVNIPLPQSIAQSVMQSVFTLIRSLSSTDYVELKLTLIQSLSVGLAGASVGSRSLAAVYGLSQSVVNVIAGKTQIATSSPISAAGLT